MRALAAEDVLRSLTRRYVLAALEPNRSSVQVLHEQDPCCFHGCNRHDRIRAYNSWVATQAAGQFVTAVTVGNAHEVNSREKTIIGGLVDQLRIQGGLLPGDLSHLPYNTMREW